MIGALLLIGDFVIFEFALDEYFFFWGVPLVAGFALTAIWLRTSRPGTRWPVPYWWLLQVLGGAAGIIGLVSLLSDLRRGVLDNGADLIGGLLLYAGAGLMLWGSRQVEPS